MGAGRSSKIGWWARSLMKGVVAYLLGLASFLSKEVGLSVFALFLVHDMMPSLDHNNVLKGAGYTLRQPMVALRALTSILTVIGEHSSTQGMKFHSKTFRHG